LDLLRYKLKPGNNFIKINHFSLKDCFSVRNIAKRLGQDDYPKIAISRGGKVESPAAGNLLNLFTAKSQVGGNLSQVGGNFLNLYTAKSQVGGNWSLVAGNLLNILNAKSHVGGNWSQVGGNSSQVGGNFSQAGGNLSNQIRAGSCV